ncbi:hypothetical protein OHA98_42375 [Streptomyces sp. NBC_00654]|uniref:hypothetical protein n=1 Tax=Streptomyces sp. NBC_00654 TaxID=2975799 RepID=UPI00225451B0|nr:hypothetical protein [Streptomyces sp. NBC_00654]MCX4971248.1 hypothetical protein [Streptomyces sp. NBC_00654]
MARRDKAFGRGLRSRRKDSFAAEEGTEGSGLLTYGGPWGVVLGGGAVVEGLHLAVAGNPAMASFTSLALAGTGFALTQFMAKLDVRAKVDRETRLMHTVNCGVVAAGVTLGTVVGLESAATAGAWATAGTGMALANNLWSKFGTKGKETKAGGKWAKLEDAIGLAKHELKNPVSNGKGTVTATVEGTDGATAEELARRIPALASALKVGKGRITHTVDEDDSSVVSLRVQVADLLKEGFPWRGPSNFGASFGDSPIRIGRYEDGEDLVLNIPGQLRDPQGLKNGNVEHGIAMGVNGAGKTVGNALIITETATRTEASVIAIDCAKFDQDFGAVRHGIAMCIKDKGTARRFFKILASVIEARTDYLAAKGLPYWKPGCGLNFLVVIGEEAADYAADNEAYQKILRTARAAGIWIETSLQRATHNNMDTDSRANSPAGLCYGLRDGSDAQYCLPDEAIEAGAWPQWGNRKPGYLYVAGLGIAEDRWHITARTENASKADLAAAITAAVDVRTPMDEVTAKALGELYTQRLTYDTPLLPAPDEDDLGAPAPAAAPAQAPVPAARQQPVEQYAEPVLSPDPPEIEEMDDVDEETMAREVEDLTEMMKLVLDEDPEPGEYQGLRLEDEIEAPEDTPVLSLDFAVDDAERLTSAQGRDALYARLDEWVRSGKFSFAPREVTDLLMRIDLGDTKRWFYRERDRLIEAGVISEDETEEGFGQYDILRSPLSDPGNVNEE